MTLEGRILESKGNFKQTHPNQMEITAPGDGQSDFEFSRFHFGLKDGAAIGKDGFTGGMLEIRSGFNVEIAIEGSERVTSRGDEGETYISALINEGSEVTFTVRALPDGVNSVGRVQHRKD